MHRPSAVALRPTARMRSQGRSRLTMGSGPRWCASVRWAMSRPRASARSRCLPLPLVASGCLGRSHSAATFNPAVPDSGCFWRCSLSDALEASSTRLEADVEEWQSSATNDDPKIGTQDAAVKRRRT